MVVAILALQGAFVEHEKMLDKLGVEYFEIRKKEDLKKEFDALILPGGESTVMGKLLSELELMEPLRERIQSGMPVFGTCAGMILLAEEIEGESPYMGTMHIRVKRNAYGRQLGSFYTEEKVKGIGIIPMTFIRAPYIEKAMEKTEVLAKVNGRIIAAKQGTQLVTAFHPELDEDTGMHEYFLKMIKCHQPERRED